MPIAQAGEAPLVLLANNNVPGTDYASTHGGDREGAEEVLLRDLLRRLGRPHRDAGLPQAHRPAARHILYKGTAPANADLMAGNVQLFMDPWTALLPLATSGRRQGLFVTSKERTPLAPNIPTSDEVGLKDFNLSSWYGVWAPKDTPDAVVDRLAAAMAEVSKDPAFIAKTTSLGIVPTARGPKEFAAFIKTEVETNTALLKEAGFKPE